MACIIKLSSLCGCIIFTCLLILLFSAKPLPQILHTWGLLPVCTRSWFWRWYLEKEWEWEKISFFVTWILENNLLKGVGGSKYYHDIIMEDYIQGDPKLAPPLPGQDKKCSMKTEHSIFKYYLFKYYLEKFMTCNKFFMSERGNLENSIFLILTTLAFLAITTSSLAAV